MKGTMKAAVFYEPEKMEIKEVPIPEISESEVLIKIKACGICGSDVSYYYGKSPLETPDGKGPLIIGHEISGEIVEIGAMVEKKGFFAVGDKVVVNPPQPCNACIYCRQTRVNLCEHTETIGVSCDGGFAEYVKVGYANVFKVPEGMDLIDAAMSEPLACSCHAVQDLDVQLGDTVIVIGSGAIGLMMAQMIKMKGAGKVIVSGRHDFQLTTAKEIGVDYVWNTKETESPYYVGDMASEMRKINGGLLAEKVIVAASGSQAYKDALMLSEKASTIVFFGLPGEQDVIEIPALAALQGNKTIKFSWLAPFTWRMAMNAIASGIQLKPLITHKFPLEKTEEGIQFMHSREPNKIKGMIVME